jgi:predicted nucleic acid-binding protein
MYLLDTTVLIDHAVGLPEAVEVVRRLFADPNDLCVCDVVVAEALSRGTDNEVSVIGAMIDALEFLAGPPESARWAGDSRRTRGASGARSLGDALIASVAVAVGATVVTRNPRDFERQGVPVLAYGT